LWPPGDASVPYNKYDDFVKAYALYTMTENPCLAVAEAHGNRFKLFIDVDLKLRNPERIVAQGAAGGSPPVLTADAGRLLLHTIYAAVDVTVYRPGACLRLIGCIKGDPRKSKATYYRPAYTMAAGGELQPVQRPFLKLVHWLQRTSIHVEEPDTAPDEYRALVSCWPTGGGRFASVTHHAELVQAVRECMFDPTFKQTPVSKITLFPPPDPPTPRHKQAPLPERDPSMVLSLNSTRCLNLLGRTHHRNNHTYL
jgi:hypothetical protein